MAFEVKLHHIWKRYQHQTIQEEHTNFRKLVVPKTFSSVMRDKYLVTRSPAVDLTPSLL